MDRLSVTPVDEETKSSMIEIRCSCKKRFQVHPDWPGKDFRCSGCGQVIAVAEQLGNSASISESTNNSDAAIEELVTDELVASRADQVPTKPSLQPTIKKPQKQEAEASSESWSLHSLLAALHPKGPPNLSLALKLTCLAVFIFALGDFVYAISSFANPFGQFAQFGVYLFGTMIRTVYGVLFSYGLFLCLKTTTVQQNRTLLMTGIALCLFGVAIDWVLAGITGIMALGVAASPTSLFVILLVRILTSLGSFGAAFVLLWFIQNVASVQKLPYPAQAAAILRYMLIGLFFINVVNQTLFTLFVFARLEEVRQRSTRRIRVVYSQHIRGEVEAHYGQSNRLNETGPIATITSILNVLVLFANFLWGLGYFAFLLAFSSKSSMLMTRIIRGVVT